MLDNTTRYMNKMRCKHFNQWAYERDNYGNKKYEPHNVYRRELVEVDKNGKQHWDTVVYKDVYEVPTVEGNAKVIYDSDYNPMFYAWATQKTSVQNNIGNLLIEKYYKDNNEEYKPWEEVIYTEGSEIPQYKPWDNLDNERKEQRYYDVLYKQYHPLDATPEEWLELDKEFRKHIENMLDSNGGMTIYDIKPPHMKTNDTYFPPAINWTKI